MPPIDPFSFLALIKASPHFHAYLKDAVAALERRLDMIEHTDAGDDDALLEAAVDELLLLFEQITVWHQHAMARATARSPAERAAALQVARRQAGFKRYFAPDVIRVDAEAGWLLVPAGDRDALDAWLTAWPE
ncbi:hypothetical protein P7L74_06015 [Tistrella mobilis]|uniref:hypothetical protein n=1 Tax=Tistrella mobilis TaxID=171437 RepID=UPI0035560FCA